MVNPPEQLTSIAKSGKATGSPRLRPKSDGGLQTRRLESCGKECKRSSSLPAGMIRVFCHLYENHERGTCTDDAAASVKRLSKPCNAEDRGVARVSRGMMPSTIELTLESMDPPALIAINQLMNIAG